MQENESIDDMITKFTKITNALTSLGDEIDNDQKVRKVIHALPPSLEIKATTLKELNNKDEMELISLIGNLKTHEIEKKAREEATPQKKKSIASKSTSTIYDDEEDDEEPSLLVRNVKRMYHKKKLNHRRRWEGKEEKKITCYNYQKPGHIMDDCPDFKNKISSSLKQKKSFVKKAFKATWDSESESENEVDTANMCFMKHTLR